MPDLWMTCDHFVGKVSAMGQPTRPTQLFIPLGSLIEYGLWGGDHYDGRPGLHMAGRHRSKSVGADLAYGL